MKHYDDNSRRMRAINAQDANRLEPEAPTRTAPAFVVPLPVPPPDHHCRVHNAMSCISPAAKAQVPCRAPRGSHRRSRNRASPTGWANRRPTSSACPRFRPPRRCRGSQRMTKLLCWLRRSKAAATSRSRRFGRHLRLGHNDAGGKRFTTATRLGARARDRPRSGQVEVIELLAKNDVLVPLTGFANSLGAAIPPLKSAPVAADILDGLRADAESQQPQVRFFARS